MKYVNGRQTGLVTFCVENCLLQRVTQGKIQGGIEVTWRQGRRRRKLLGDLKERRGYCHLNEEALDRTMWRAGFGRGFGHVVRQTAKWMNHTVSLWLLCNSISCKVCKGHAYRHDQVFVPRDLADLKARIFAAVKNIDAPMSTSVCGKNLNIVSKCAVSPRDTAHI
jgi:hypothetical protein